MIEDPKYIEVYVDALSNLPKNDKNREITRQSLKIQFEKSLPEAVERFWDLPSIIVKPQGEYLAFLSEARILYIAGHFYSCVAMCGIVGERLIKDVSRASILVQKIGANHHPPQRPSDTAFDQLERIEVSHMLRFLEKADLLSGEASGAAQKLIEMRNDYAHARGKASQPEALKAIKFLHILVEGTVSVFKDFDIKDGILVPKTTA